ncbi:MAG: response regulator transcription factor [Clostridia bacterium]|nr:response regulator transcription factor [Clostridia bacterium]
MSKILIIEDDRDIAEVERDYLAINGFDADITDNGITGIDMVKQDEYNLVLLDLMLPGLDGFTVCKKLREITDIPVLMVTARKEDIDKIRGLGLGADDYIEKPFSPNVLVARVKANLAQYERLKKTEEKKETVIDVGDYKINTSSHRVYKHGEEVELKNKEYELFLFLVMNADIVFDKEALYEKIWGLDSLGDTATVAVHINRLREKLEDDPSNPKHIQTVWGAGYRFKN